MVNKNFLIFIIVAFGMLAVVYYFSGIAQDISQNEPVNEHTSADTLEQELIDTDLDSLDQEFSDIEMELEGAVSETP